MMGLSEPGLLYVLLELPADAFHVAFLPVGNDDRQGVLTHHMEWPWTVVATDSALLARCAVGVVRIGGSPSSHTATAYIAHPSQSRAHSPRTKVLLHRARRSCASVTRLRPSRARSLRE